MNGSDIPMVAAIREYCDELGPERAYDLYANAVLSVLLSEEDIDNVVSGSVPAELDAILALVDMAVVKCVYRYFSPRHIRQLNEGVAAAREANPDFPSPDEIRAWMKERVERGKRHRGAGDV